MTFLQILLVLAAAIFGSLHFFKARILEKAELVAKHSAIAKSPNGYTYVGFTEDCEGKINNEDRGHCVRIIYYYKGQKERGTCIFGGGQLNSNERMFQDITFQWSGNQTVEWTSTFAKMPLTLDGGACTSVSGFESLFELIPTYRQTVNRYYEYEAETLERKNRKAMEEARRQILVNPQ